MAEITLKRKGEIVQGVFKILLDHPNGLAVRIILEKLANSMELTDFEKSEYPNHPGVRRFERIVRFSTIGAVKAGWMVKNKGQWVLTEQGRRAYKEIKDPTDLNRKQYELYRAWKKDQPETHENVVVDSEEPSVTFEEAEENAWADIQEHLGNMNPYDLQDLVSGLLKAMEYHVYWVSPPGQDQGIDIIAYADPLGIEGSRIKVQVKRRADKIAVDGVQSFMALLGEGDVGIFVALGGFTSDAEKEARKQESRRLMLIDAEKLVDLWIEHYDDIPEKQKRLLPLRPIYYLDISE